MAGEVAAEAGRIPKPVLRGLHQASVKKHLIIATGLVVISGVIMQVFRNGPKKNDYAEFYKNYDDDKVFRRMRDAGLLQSAPAE